jgi:hypothetical protein
LKISLYKGIKYFHLEINRGEDIMGAGVIPFSVHRGQVCFLFQKVFSGRKTGYLIDFGGGLNEGENYQQAAMREFIEETETMFFSEGLEELKIAQKTPERIARQLPLVSRLFERTLQQHPLWWCHREPGGKVPLKDWNTYFIEFEYQDLKLINEEWEVESMKGTRFSKRRELHWIDADQLLFIYDNNPEKLWKRVRQLVNARTIVQMIKLEKSSPSPSPSPSPLAPAL